MISSGQAIFTIPLTSICKNRNIGLSASLRRVQSDCRAASCSAVQTPVAVAWQTRMKSKNAAVLAASLTLGKQHSSRMSRSSLLRQLRRMYHSTSSTRHENSSSASNREHSSIRESYECVYRRAVSAGSICNDRTCYDEGRTYIATHAGFEVEFPREAAQR